MNPSDIIRTEYSSLMQQSYIDYAMSVIVDRALPDVRDGLKPVQRRILYDMSELRIHSDGPYRKCARIVGDTMGKYHPHGDSSIYEALVVMSQDFKKSLPLVDGHGNFGNIEGDGAAAMRYTEAKLARVSEETMLADLDLGVVDFIPNFDETEKEPEVLPVRIPNILINGAEGIAVGMATAIPPHNAAEVIDALIAYMRDSGITTKRLMKYIKGPDFPTGGIIANADELENLYETGTGKLRIRGRVEVERGRSGRTNVVITEIPYTMIGAGIAKFMSDVQELAESRKTADIVDISNQSSKEGIRIVIELRKDADTERFINLLYKKTRLEDTFGVNMLAISQGRPETLSLRDILEACTQFQYELADRKYATLLQRARAKSEIEEGLIEACDCIDLIIEIIRGSRDRAQAKRCLTTGDTTGIVFKSDEAMRQAGELRFSEAQADAILEMRLYKLIGLEIDALLEEHAKTVAAISTYEDILDNHDSMMNVIISELTSYRKQFARPRRTEVSSIEEVVYEEPPKETSDVVFMMDRFGYAKVVDRAAYDRYMDNKEPDADDNIRFTVCCKSDDKIALFTDTGNVHALAVEKLPLSKPKDKGVPVDNASNADTAKEQVLCCESFANLPSLRVLTVTKYGQVKITAGAEFVTSRKTISATKLSVVDSLVAVALLTGTAESDRSRDIVLQSSKGRVLRFGIDQISTQGRVAAGVKGMKLLTGDYVESVRFVAAVDEPDIRRSNRGR